MSVPKVIALLLGLMAVSFAAKYALSGTLSQNPEGATQARRQLDTVRDKAKDLERQQQKAADEIAEKAAAGR